MKRGANVNTPEFKQVPPLHFAVNNDNLTCTKWLVQFGANINYQAPTNTTALSLAIMLGRIQIINVLVENCANINVRDITVPRFFLMCISISQFSEW
jgi:ankyrin repeat protein